MNKGSKRQIQRAQLRAEEETRESSQQPMGFAVATPSRLAYPQKEVRASGQADLVKCAGESPSSLCQHV